MELSEGYWKSGQMKNGLIEIEIVRCLLLVEMIGRYVELKLCELSNTR